MDDKNNLTFKKFSGRAADFTYWLRDFETRLDLKGLGEFAERQDACPMPLDPQAQPPPNAQAIQHQNQLIAEWTRNNRTLFGYLTLALDDSTNNDICANFQNKDGRAALTYVKNRYQRRDIVTFGTLQRELYSMALTDNMEMIKYVSEIRNHCRRIREIKRNAVDTETEITAILTGLTGPYYNYAESKFLSDMTALTVDAVVNDLLQLEVLHKRNNKSGDVNNTFALHSAADRFKTQCTYCGKFGHKEEVCYKKKRDLAATTPSPSTPQPPVKHSTPPSRDKGAKYRGNKRNGANPNNKGKEISQHEDATANIAADEDSDDLPYAYANVLHGGSTDDNEFPPSSETYPDLIQFMYNSNWSGNSPTHSVTLPSDMVTLLDEGGNSVDATTATITVPGTVDKQQTGDFLCCLSTTEQVEWILDSGCTAHMCSNKEAFSHLTPKLTVAKVITADKTEITPAGSGTVLLLMTDVNNKKVRLQLNNVAYVPQLGFNLLSTCQMADSGHYTSFP